jgi:hypothetical protein
MAQQEQLRQQQRPQVLRMAALCALAVLVDRQC